MSERDRLVATLRERASDQLTFAETHVAQITAALARARSSLHKRPTFEEAWDTAGVLVSSAASLADVAKALGDYFPE
jgi:hypothetical protein